MDPIAYEKIMCNLTSHNFRGKRTIFRQPNIIFPRAAYRRLNVYGVFSHPDVWAKYEGGEVQWLHRSRTPTHSRTTPSLYSSSYWTVWPATAKSRTCKPPVIGANLYAVLCELLTLMQSSSHGSQVMVTRVIWLDFDFTLGLPGHTIYGR